jgi:hypothetical protein
MVHMKSSSSVVNKTGKEGKQMKRRDLLRSLGSLAIGFGAVSMGSLALARIGRPATPASVAGVRRRTRRRTRRRVFVGMSLTTLPYGCGGTVMHNGIPSYYCGGIWYQPQQQGNTVVYVVDSVDPGAETNVEFYE